MLLHICSLLKVWLQSSLRFANFLTLSMISGLKGLSEQLFEKLTASPAEPHLKGLKEIFVNFNGL